MFCTFWLTNVFLATAACNFSTSELQKVLRDRQFFNILTSKCASRHSGVQFFNIFAPICLRIRCFKAIYLAQCCFLHWKVAVAFCNLQCQQWSHFDVKVSCNLARSFMRATCHLSCSLIMLLSNLLCAVQKNQVSWTLFHLQTHYHNNCDAAPAKAAKVWCEDVWRYIFLNTI